MTLLDFTSYEEIRAALGVSVDEILDETLALKIYLVRLQEELRTVNLSIATDFLALTEPLTTDEERFSNLMETYSSYFVASTLLGALPLFAPKTIKDQHAVADRVTDPFEGLRDDVMSTLKYLKAALIDAYAVLNPAQSAATAPTRVLVLNSGLALDPVTGA